MIIDWETLLHEINYFLIVLDFDNYFWAYIITTYAYLTEIHMPDSILSPSLTSQGADQ